MDSLEEWDRNIAPLLFGIAADCFWTQRKAEAILSRCKRLVKRPEWESTAEAELNGLIVEVQKVLELLQEAKQVYMEKEKFR